jgi:hypothetical protein
VTDLDEAVAKTLADAPPCVSALGDADRSAVAAWAIGEQARLLRRWVAALGEVSADAEQECEEALALAARLDDRGSAAE